MKVLFKIKNGQNETSGFEIGGSKFFYKVLPLRVFQKELSGYLALKDHYPVPRLLSAQSNKETGVLLFDYEDTIAENSGLLVDLFAQKGKLDKDFLPIIKLYKKVFLSTLRKGRGSTSDIFFKERVSTRLPLYYRKTFINSIDGKTVRLNDVFLKLQLARTIQQIKDYFKKDKTHWCVLSQCDPNDLNIGTKPVLFDYLGGGLNPLMAEFATLFWYNLAQGNYFSLIYNPKTFKMHEDIRKKIDRVEIRSGKIDHKPSLVRKEFIETYTNQVVMPCLAKIPNYEGWYQDFKNFLAMRILGVFNVSAMKEKDKLLSLAYLEYFYNQVDPKTPRELVSLI